MSFLDSIFLKNYRNDIVEASNGFFLAMCDRIDFGAMYKRIKKLPVSKMLELAKYYNVNLDDQRDYNCKEMLDEFGNVIERVKLDESYVNDVEVADRYFKKFVTMNHYSVYETVKRHITKPKLERVYDIYGNDKVIYAKLELSAIIDIKNYVGRRIYSKFEDVDEKYRIKNYKKSYFKTDNRKVSYFMACTFEIDNILKSFKVNDVSMIDPCVNYPFGVMNYDNDMVPNGLSYEEMARKFIEKYDVKIPLNINKLLDDMGIKIDRRYKLLQSDKSKINAQICLTSGMLDTADGLVYVEDNTILVDRDYNYGDGAFALLILHELIHLEYHKYYLTLKQQLSGSYAVTSRIIESKYRNPSLATVEKQAKEISARVLVPTDILQSKLFDKYAEYDYFFNENKQLILNKIAYDLRDYFGCSKYEVDIRIKQDGIFTCDIDLTKLDKTYITEEEKDKLYNTDTEFKNMLDSGKIIFLRNRCVVNNSNFVNNDRVTFKAYDALEESMVHFKKQSNTFYDSDDSLASIVFKDKLLDRMKSLNLSASFDLAAMFSKFRDEDKYEDLFVKDVGRTIKNIRLSKNIGEIALAKRCGIDVQDVHRLENNVTTNYDLKKIVKMCKALNLPKKVTVTIVNMAGGFDADLSDRAVEFVVENYYNNDLEDFCSKVDEATSFGALAEKENIKLNKEDSISKSA